MLSWIRPFILTWAIIVALVFQVAVPPALAQEKLPRPEPVFQGHIGVTYQDSQPDTALLQAEKAPGGAPNVLLVLIDDAGFGSASTFGGPIATPTFDRLAANGLRYNTFHTTALCSPTRAAILTGRKHIEFAGNMPSIPEGSAPSTKNASHTIDADLMIPPHGAEGVIFSEGGVTSGFSLYVKDNTLTYDYNWFDLERTSIAASTPLPTGRVHVRFDFAYDGGGPGKSGTGTLYVNNRKVGQGKIPKTVAGRFGVEAMDFGKDLQSPVSQSYQPPFAFTGVVEKVVLDIK